MVQTIRLQLMSHHASSTSTFRRTLSKDYGSLCTACPSYFSAIRAVDRMESQLKRTDIPALANCHLPHASGFARRRREPCQAGSFKLTGSKRPETFGHSDSAE